jgi:hypothetical protein
MKLSELRRRSSRIEDGDWIAIEALAPLELRVRGMASRAWRNCIDRLLATLTPAERRDPVALERVTDAAMLDAGLLDWKGLTNEAGEPLPYDRVLAAELLSDATLFRDACFAAASQIDRGG